MQRVVAACCRAVNERDDTMTSRDGRGVGDGAASRDPRGAADAVASGEASDLDRVRAGVLASWRAFAQGAPDAAVRTVGGATAAIFPAGPARAVFNNALLDRGLDRDAADAALAALEETYAAAGVPGFAAWAQEDDAGALAALKARGYRFAEATRPMLARLDGAAGPAGRSSGAGASASAERAAAERAPGGAAAAASVERVADPAESLVLNGVAADLLDPPPAGGRWYVAREGGRAVSTALALVLDGDCQISFVATHPDARRRGHAGRVLARLLADAVADGCTTASLHATEVAEPLYAAHGFRPLGRFAEWEPPRF